MTLRYIYISNILIYNIYIYISHILIYIFISNILIKAGFVFSFKIALSVMEENW